VAIIVPAMALAHSANSAIITAMMKDERNIFFIQPPFPQKRLKLKKIKKEPKVRTSKNREKIDAFCKSFARNYDYIIKKI
jgi:hypothetical protein